MTRVIKFSQRYRKLSLDVFTTIRSHNPEKWEYYKENLGNVFDIEVNGNVIFQAKLLWMVEIPNPNELPPIFLEFDTDNEWTFRDLPHMVLLLRRC